MNRYLKSLFLYNAIFVFAGNLLGPLYALYVSKIDNKIFAISLSWTVFLVSTTIFTFFISRVGDQIKRKDYLIIAGYLTRALVWIGYLFVKDIQLLLLLQILLGIGESLGTPAYDAILAEHLDKKAHIKDYATWKVISNLVAASATFAGGIIVNQFGFRTLFPLMAVLALIATCGIAFKDDRAK